MGNIMKFHSADMGALMDRINKYSIGMDNYFERLGTLHETTSNYPPYNLVTVSEVEYRLELALAGFKKKESMSTHKTENSLSMDKKRIKSQKQNTSIEEWLKDLSLEHGPSVTRRKLDQLALRMDVEHHAWQSCP